MSFWEDIKAKFVRPSVHTSLSLTPFDAFEDDEELYCEDEVRLEPISGFALILDYGDSKGHVSQRLVTCNRIAEHGDKKYIHAFCHMREAQRQFRMDRIISIYDPSTGECLDPVDEFIGRFSIDERHASPYGWGLSVQRRADFIALLNTLVFIARCDREYHPLERLSIEEFAARFWLRMEVSGDPDGDSILRYADRLAPDAETFWVSLHRIAGNPKLVRILKESVISVIDADGVHTREEFYWGSKIDEFFAKP